MEQWRNIPGYPSRFQVSDAGRVRTIDYEYLQKKRGGGFMLKFRKGRILAQCINNHKGGYAQVTMTYSDLGQRYVWSGKVHRLVALAFIPNPKGLKEVNHKDSNKLNNHAENLEWVTKSENILHNYLSGTRKAHGKKRAIVGVRNGDVVRFESLLASQKSGLFSMSAIQKCLANQAKMHKGYVWCYEENFKEK
jgi:hypothetical protein